MSLLGPHTRTFDITNDEKELSLTISFFKRYITIVKNNKVSVVPHAYFVPNFNVPRQIRLVKRYILLFFLYIYFFFSSFSLSGFFFERFENYFRKGAITKLRYIYITYDIFKCSINAFAFNTWYGTVRPTVITIEITSFFFPSFRRGKNIFFLVFLFPVIAVA